MNIKSETQSKRNFLGYFLLLGGSSSCIIIDWNYGSLCLDYGIDDQIVIPVNSELGYVRAGICVDIDLTSDSQVTNDIEIPVYADYQGDLLTNICIEIDLWISAVDITKRQEPTVEGEEYKSLNQTTQLARKLIGYVTATGHGIIICDIDMLRMCENYNDYVNSQITIPPDGEIIGFRVGVLAEIQLDDKEFPVYGEYKDDSIKRIIIEITHPTEA
jgi:hypothetical protein